MRWTWNWILGLFMRHWNNVLIWSKTWVEFSTCRSPFCSWHSAWDMKTRWHSKHNSGRWIRPSTDAEVSHIDPDPVSFLQVSDISFCVWVLFDGLWQPPLSTVADYLTGRTRGKDGGEREEERAEEGSCSAVTISPASESIPFVYRPFHSPLPVTSLVSVPLILPDI